uniref:CYTOSOL_AP domain-containing protein n=1 Tax=Panagrellus redivivus TaxID=6233 RepID=A0A7E4USG4_PANRE
MALKAATRLLLGESIKDAVFDSVVLVSHSTAVLEQFEKLKGLLPAVQSYAQLNAAIDKGAANLIPTDAVSSSRLIYSSTGSVTSDFDDVRKYSSAATIGIQTAIKAGSNLPLLVVIPHPRFPEAELVAATGALHAAYVPYNVRSEENKPLKIEALGLFPLSDRHSDTKFQKLVAAVERAFIACRDVGDGDPQRMAPTRVAEYVEALFEGSNIKVDVESDVATIAKEYPLLAAVNRAANNVPEHQARVVWLEYVSEEPSETGKEFETIMLVGKGVTIDTGGVDVKIAGNMLGMCRDKYGAAVVVGFFEALNQLQPKGIKVKAALSLCRNSIGSNSYTCDEIIVSRSNKRIHIINTDAEGRLAMLDPLTKFTEEAVNEKNPHLYTVATLTGHEVITYGYHAAIMDNGPARAAGHDLALQATSDIYGQSMEISRLHYEDLDFNDAETPAADLRQGNNKPSVATLRGHMSPAGFLIRGSGLDKHGLDSDSPIKYTHVDMGAAMGEAPKPSYPNPLLALIGFHILPRL